jgi:hypothetical protein
MPSNPSTRNRIELQAAGENLNTWGAPKLNAALQRLEEAKDGRLNKSLTGLTTYTLTATNYVADEARMGFLDFSGTPISTCTVTVPAVEKTYLVRNATTQTLILTTGSGVTATLLTGTSATIACDATNVRVVGVDADDLANTLTTAKFYTDSVATGSGNLPGSTGLADYVLMTQNSGAGGGSPQFFSASAAATKLGVGSLAGANAWAGSNTFVTQLLNDTSTKAATMAALNALAVDRGYLSGLTISTAGSSAIFGIAPGQASDSTGVARINLGSAYTKTTSAWALGTGNGALLTGSIANNTWYHVFPILRTDTGVVDVGLLPASLGVDPTAYLPANYTRYRRIGSMKTNGSAQWVSFTQNGDEFLLLTPILEAGAASTTATPFLVTLAAAPTGVKVNAIVAANTFNGTGAAANYFNVSATDTGGIAASSNTGQASWVGGSTVGQAEVNVRTNTSAQIYVAVSSASSTTYQVYTKGWIDRRGRDD